MYDVHACINVTTDIVVCILQQSISREQYAYMYFHAGAKMLESVPIRELRANTEMCGELFVCDKGLLVFKNIQPLRRLKNILSVKKKPLFCKKYIDQIYIPRILPTYQQSTSSYIQFQYSSLEYQHARAHQCMLCIRLILRILRRMHIMPNGIYDESYDYYA